MIKFPTSVEYIGLLGDVHGNTAYTVAAINQMFEADVIVQLGDFGYNFSDDFLDEIQGVLEYNAQILMFVDGNHENFNWLYAQPVSDDGVRRLRDNIWHLPRGFRWEWDGVSFLALGGAHSVDRQGRVPYISWWPEERITYAEAMKVANDGLADVMFTHDCPDAVATPLGNPDWIPEIDLVYSYAHRALLGNVVDEVKPRYLFHGHYHVCYEAHRDKTNTTVVGLGCDGFPYKETTSVWSLEDFK